MAWGRHVAKANAQQSPPGATRYALDRNGDIPQRSVRPEAAAARLHGLSAFPRLVESSLQNTPETRPRHGDQMERGLPERELQIVARAAQKLNHMAVAVDKNTALSARRTL
jgi:hypothetical protein